MTCGLWLNIRAILTCKFLFNVWLLVIEWQNMMAIRPFIMRWLLFSVEHPPWSLSSLCLISCVSQAYSAFTLHSSLFRLDFSFFLSTKYDSWFENTCGCRLYALCLYVLLFYFLIWLPIITLIQLSFVLFSAEFVLKSLCC